MEKKKGRIRTLVAIIALIVITMTAILLDLGWANWPLSISEVIDVLLGGGSAVNRTIVLNINLPRVVMGLFVGAGLAVAGAVMQAIFKNPMASPYILGLSNGAALGAAIGMVFTISFIPIAITVPVLAFIFCLGTMILVYSLSRVSGTTQTETLLLSGIAVSALLSALVSLMTFLAGDQMEGIVFWTMGSLSKATWSNLMFVIPVISVGIFIMTTMSREINAMMLGDAHAMDLGVDVRRVRILLLVCTTLVVAAAVSFVGVIGFVGLVIPHVVRLIVGPDNRIVIPITIFAGASYLVICDYIAHCMYGISGVLPIGIITAIIGGPYFIYLLRRRKHEVGWN